MVIVLRIASVLAGVVVILATVLSAVRTTVLPRGVPSRLSRFVFVLVRWAFQVRVGRAPTYDLRDRVYANYGPFALLFLLQSWLLLVYGGFVLAQWAAEPARGLGDALVMSGSSLLTLGFDVPRGGLSIALAFVEASIGLLLVTLLISYLPVIYAAFSRREAAVAKLEVRAGSPPTCLDLLTRAWRLERFDRLTTTWGEMETWFVDIEESHTSFAALVFFRSPQPEHSWITAAGAVLDSAALLAAVLDVSRDVEAELCIRSGYLALRRIADFFQIPYPSDPRPGDPISISRDEWETVVDGLASAGLPVRADREQAWRDWAGWRVNYDRPLIALGMLAQAPYAPWSTDRSLADFRSPPMFLRKP